MVEAGDCTTLQPYRLMEAVYIIGVVTAGRHETTLPMIPFLGGVLMGAGVAIEII